MQPKFCSIIPYFVFEWVFKISTVAPELYLQMHKREQIDGKIGLLECEVMHD